MALSEDERNKLLNQRWRAFQRKRSLERKIAARARGPGALEADKAFLEIAIEELAQLDAQLREE